MKNINPLRTARRKRQRRERLGTDAFCLFCGYAYLEALTCVSRDWLEAHGIPGRVIDRMLEDHHSFTRNDPSTVVLCLNCHREITEGLMSAGVSMRPERNPHKRVALQLQALAVQSEIQARAYRKWANDLITEPEEQS